MEISLDGSERATKIDDEARDGFGLRDKVL
jgi:hypothetical protein